MDALACNDRLMRSWAAFGTGDERSGLGRKRGERVVGREAELGRGVRSPPALSQ
jgi:hypothetical protein